MINVNDKVLDLDKFPDGTLLLKFAVTAPVIDISWRYETDAEVFALICVTRHLKQLNPEAEFVLTVLYLPNARMDRVKAKEDVFTLKYLAEIINGLEFNKVRVLDPHSEVSYSADSDFVLNNLEILSPKPYIDEAIARIGRINDPPDTVFFVDKGGKNRYANMILLPSVYGDKVRNWETGQILETAIVGDQELIKDKNIIIIDDIISYGGSIYYNALKLKELGCRSLYVFATHVENSILDENRGKLINSGLIDRLYTTDSLFTKSHELIEVIKLGG